MKKPFALVLSCVVMFCCVHPLSAQEKAVDPGKAADIRTLLMLTGSDAMMVQMAGIVMQDMASVIKKQHPNISDGFHDLLAQETASMMREKMSEPGGIMDRMVPLYDKYFDDQEIITLIELYSHPTVQKAAKLGPRMMEEAQVIGEQWAVGIMPALLERMERRLREEAYLPKKDSN